MNQVVIVEEVKEFCSWSEKYLQLFLFKKKIISCLILCEGFLHVDGELKQTHVYNNIRLHMMVWLIWSDSDLNADFGLTFMPHLHFHVTFEIKTGSPKMQVHARA